MSSGMLDPRFGTGGIVPVGFISFDVAVDSLGRTVIAGENGGDVAVLRLNANGTPDLGFGNNGLVTTDLGGKRFDRAQKVAIQPDGKIIVAGLRVNSGGVGNHANGQFALVRYNLFGGLDTSFGDGGKETVLGALTTDGVSGLGVQPDSKIVFSGSYKHGGDFDFITFRLQSSGLLDGTFGDARSRGSAGYVVTGLGGDDAAAAQFIQPDGKIVVAGTRFMFDNDEFNPDRIALVRYSAAGKLDNSFDGDGKLFTRFVGDSTLYSMTEQPDGKILVGGTLRGNNGRTQMVLTRFNQDGSDDSSLRTIVTNVAASTVPTNIFLRADRIVVVGMEQAAGQVANTFATQYLLNGTPDSTFGDGGVAHLKIPGGASWPSATLAPDGKIAFAYQGGSSFGGVARFIQVVPQAYVVAGGFIGTEGSKDASFRVGRDQAYDFPTRVYLNVRGTAGFLDDYTGTGLNTPGFIVDSQGNPTKFRTEDFHNPPQAYVDIPAGRVEVTVPLTIINDTQLEPTETATFIVFDNPNYARNQRLQDTTVSIFDNDDARINFQAASKTLADNSYRQDVGKKFANRGNGLSYGWDADNAGNARIRGNSRSPGFKYDSFNHMQKNGANRKWEIGVPNGLYQVTVVAGDPGATDSVYRINLEGQPALSGTPSGDVRWFTSTTNVMVTDGRLTVSNGAGAVNNKIAFIEINNPRFGAEPGIVVPSTAVHLKPAPAKPPVKKALAGFTRSFFSEQSIENPIVA